MATNTFVHFEHPEAQYLADLQSVSYDLFSTIDLCNYFDGQSSNSVNGYPPGEITDAFSTAILVRYSRPFQSGVRHRLDDSALSILSKEELAKHERFRAIRDKHIAHSVNDFEETKVQARYWVERVQEEGITQISTLHSRVLGLSSQDTEDIANICRKLSAFVDGEIEREKSRILALVRSLPLEEVLAAKTGAWYGPRKSAEAKSRRAK